MLHRDSLAIISIRGARAFVAPRVWRDLDSVELTHGSTSVVVGLKRVAGRYGCIDRPRVWFVCPMCGSLAGAIGFTCEATPPYGCRRCLRWRSREYKVSSKAPHIGPVAAAPHV